jgi:hypothetical protein
MKKLLVALLVLGLAAPAMAAEVNVYGSFRTHLGYYDVSEEYGQTGSGAVAAINGPGMDATVGAAGGFDDAGTVLSLGGQSRMGAKAKISDTLNATYEVGFRETQDTGSAELVYLRMAYATWNFGAGAFTFGKTYTPLTYLFYSNMIGDIGDQGDAVMLVAGIPYAGRQPQLRLTFGGFDIAAIEQNTNLTADMITPILAGTNDIDYVLPKFEASYAFNTPMISIRPAVGYQSYDVVTRGVTEEEESVDSYIGALGVQLRFNPVYINLMGSYQQNPANYGIANFVIGSSFVGNLGSAQMAADGSIEDATAMTGLLVVGAKLSPMLKVEAGMSYNYQERDEVLVAVPGVGNVNIGDVDQTAFLYYIQMPITAAPGVTITPEIGMVDRGDTEFEGGVKEDMGSMTYGVVSFRVDF